LSEHFQVTPLAPALGARVDGLDLAAAPSDEVMRALIGLLHERGVVVIPGQSLTKAQYDRFGRYWGRPLEFFIADHRNPEFPALIEINNDPATPEPLRDGAVHWHSDSTYEEEPAAVTMLYGIEAPQTGGATQWASTTAAYDALPGETKARLEGLVAIHRLGQAPWIDGETRPDPRRPQRDLPAQRHPLIVRHPVTGRPAIFTSGTACAIEGMDQAQATDLIRSLREHVVKPEFRLEYKVAAGDVALWDNYTTVHTAAPIAYSSEDGKRRRLFRISTKGLPSLFAPLQA
jgi:taurine dioxygenase